MRHRSPEGAVYLQRVCMGVRAIVSIERRSDYEQSIDV